MKEERFQVKTQNLSSSFALSDINTLNKMIEMMFTHLYDWGFGYKLG